MSRAGAHSLRRDRALRSRTPGVADSRAQPFADDAPHIGRDGIGVARSVGDRTTPGLASNDSQEALAKARMKSGIEALEAVLRLAAPPCPRESNARIDVEQNREIR